MEKMIKEIQEEHGSGNDEGKSNLDSVTENLMKTGSGKFRAKAVPVLYMKAYRGSESIDILRWLLHGLLISQTCSCQ